MRVVGSMSPEIPCGCPVNSLPFLGTPSVYAGLMQKLIFAVIYADTYAVRYLISVLTAYRGKPSIPTWNTAPERRKRSPVSCSLVGHGPDRFCQLVVGLGVVELRLQQESLGFKFLRGGGLGLRPQISTSFELLG